MVKNYLAKNVILIRAFACPSHMPGQYTVQMQIVVGGVDQAKNQQLCNPLSLKIH